MNDVMFSWTTGGPARIEASGILHVELHC